ncbi:YdcF family protein [Nocardia sp. NPDC052254]|uniref:YdcF family protein n=1 Tax=Nocardia sp. NPDC052254 TaxID=3155681 RepID=UPI00341CF027
MRGDRRPSRPATRLAAGFVGGSAAAFAAALLAAERVHSRASGRLLGSARSPRPGGTDVVVVLGYPAASDGSTTALQRWRCRIGARSLAPERAGFLVFTGGAVHGPWVEAEVMAAYAHDRLGVPLDRIRVEPNAESTWQNIEFTTPLIENADRIIIASDPMHAARARRYLRIQRPDLAERLAPADDYRPFERWWLKIPTAAHELAAISRRRAGAAATPMLRRMGLLQQSATPAAVGHDDRR